MNKLDGDDYFVPMGGVFSGVPIYAPRTKEKRKAAAATLSAIGWGLNKIPVIGPFLGALASYPDLGYDLIDFKKNPNLVNAGHVLLDGINRYTRFTQTPYDDYIGNLGVIDDLSQGVGYDLLEELGKMITNKDTIPKISNIRYGKSQR